MSCDFPTEKITICDALTVEDGTQILADLLPTGQAMQAKNTFDKNLRKLMEASSGELVSLINTIFLICNDYNPAFTEYMLERWESLLQIPDACFSLASTIEERRANVLIKLATLNVTTEEDYIALAACLGFDITVTYPFPFHTFPYQFPFLFGGNEDDLFTVIINIKFDKDFEFFPYEFPFPFGVSPKVNQLICLFDSLKPIHIHFEYIFDQ